VISLVNLYHSPGRDYELFYSRQQSGLDASDIDLNVEYFHVGGVLWGQGRPFHPFLAGGIGATRLRASGAESGTDTRPSMSIGVGLKMPFAEQWSARLEIRGYGTATGGERDLLCISGPEGAECKVRYEGDFLFQAEALAGLTFRF